MLSHSEGSPSAAVASCSIPGSASSVLDEDLQQLACTWACEDNDCMDVGAISQPVQTGPLLRTITTGGAGSTAVSAAACTFPQPHGVQALQSVPELPITSSAMQPAAMIPTPTLAAHASGHDLQACPDAELVQGLDSVPKARTRKRGPPMPLIKTRTKNGRRKCTTERNKSRVDALAEQVSATNQLNRGAAVGPSRMCSVVCRMHTISRSHVDAASNRNHPDWEQSLSSCSLSCCPVGTGF